MTTTVKLTLIVLLSTPAVFAQSSKSLHFGALTPPKNTHYFLVRAQLKDTTGAKWDVYPNKKEAIERPSDILLVPDRCVREVIFVEGPYQNYHRIALSYTVGPADRDLAYYYINSSDQAPARRKLGVWLPENIRFEEFFVDNFYPFIQIIEDPADIGSLILNEEVSGLLVPIIYEKNIENYVSSFERRKWANERSNTSLQVWVKPQLADAADIIMKQLQRKGVKRVLNVDEWIVMPGNIKPANGLPEETGKTTRD